MRLGVKLGPIYMSGSTSRRRGDGVGCGLVIIAGLMLVVGNWAGSWAHGWGGSVAAWIVGILAAVASIVGLLSIGLIATKVGEFFSRR